MIAVEPALGNLMLPDGRRLKDSPSTADLKFRLRSCGLQVPADGGAEACAKCYKAHLDQIANTAIKSWMSQWQG